MSHVNYFYEYADAKFIPTHYYKGKRKFARFEIKLHALDSEIENPMLYFIITTVTVNVY